MDYAALATELAATHPVTGAYSADAVTAAAQLNAANIASERATLTGSEIFECVDAANYAALVAADKTLLQTIVGLGDLIKVTTGSRTRTLLLNMFGAGTATRTALAAAVAINVSRAQQLLGGPVSAGDVDRARLA